MRERLVTERIGEDMGPIDWTHEIARDKPSAWRCAEVEPDKFLYNGRTIIAIRMYDGWPYWTPRPAILFMGPIGSEWDFFDSYGCYENSIAEKGS